MKRGSAQVPRASVTKTKAGNGATSFTSSSGGVVNGGGITLRLPKSALMSVKDLSYYEEITSVFLNFYEEGSMGYLLRLIPHIFKF